MGGNSKTGSGALSIVQSIGCFRSGYWSDTPKIKIIINVERLIWHLYMLRCYAL